jgi:hypothetical protein
MARARPKTGEDLLHIPGVGPAKAARFGAIFLAVIANHNEENEADLICGNLARADGKGL